MGVMNPMYTIFRKPKESMCDMCDIYIYMQTKNIL